LTSKKLLTLETGLWRKEKLVLEPVKCPRSNSRLLQVCTLTLIKNSRLRGTVCPDAVNAFHVTRFWDHPANVVSTSNSASFFWQFRCLQSASNMNDLSSGILLFFMACWSVTNYFSCVHAAHGKYFTSSLHYLQFTYDLELLCNTLF
jgi:hypothetical protein